MKLALQLARGGVPWCSLWCVVACGGPADERVPAAGPTEAEAEHAPDRTAHPEDTVAPEASLCAEALRAETPAPLRAALGALGWATVYDDACVADAALRARDVEACDALTLRPLREHCRDHVAIASEMPLSCTTSEEGHDPLCLALAARSVRLCRAVPLARRALCESLLDEGGIERCDRSDVPDARSCREEHESLLPFLSAGSREPGGLSPRVTLRTTRVVELGTSTSREDPITEDLSDHELGAVLRWDGCDAVLSVGAADAEPLSRRTRFYVEARLSPSALVEGAAAAEVMLGERGRAEIERTSFGRAEAGGVAGGRGTVRVELSGASLGAPVRVVLEGSLERSPGRVETNLEVRTLLRDIMGEPGPGCAP